MKRYVVTTTILSRAEGTTPQDVTYYRGEDPFAMLRNLLSAATRRDDEAAASGLPLSMQYDVTSVRLDIFDIEHVYGACGVEDCDECRPLFDASNREMPEPDTEGMMPYSDPYVDPRGDQS